MTIPHRDDEQPPQKGGRPVFQLRELVEALHNHPPEGKLQLRQVLPVDCYRVPCDCALQVVRHLDISAGLVLVIDDCGNLHQPVEEA